MGIRGTELLVNVLKQNKKDITQVALLEGEVRLYGNGKIKDQDMLPGDHTIISRSDQEMEKETKILSAEEKKSFEGFLAPDIPNLLEPVALNEVSKGINEKTNSILTPKADTQTVDSSEECADPKSKSFEKVQTFKDTLQELNNAWGKKPH